MDNYAPQRLLNTGYGPHPRVHFPRTMGLFERRYTDEQKQAAIAYSVDQGHSVRLTMEAAAAGTLAPGLEPFELSKASASEWTRTERRRRQGLIAPSKIANDPRLALRSIGVRLTVLLEAETVRLEQAAKANRKPLDDTRIVGIARAGREAAALLRATEGPDPTGRGDAKQKGQRADAAISSAPSPVLAGLLKQSAQRPSETAPTDHENKAHNGTSGTPTTQNAADHANTTV